jgi:hypothetical protein
MSLKHAGLGIFIVTEVVCIGTAFLGFLVGGLTAKLLTRREPRRHRGSAFPEKNSCVPGKPEAAREAIPLKVASQL